jgi:hypothetical protein
MPLKYWDEAFFAATYLINRTPTKLLQYDTPLHTLLYTKPDYSSFRVFRCACWPNLHPYNISRDIIFNGKVFPFASLAPMPALYIH